MATLATETLTLVDFAKRLDPDTNSVTQAIAELLSETNEILTDMLWREGNLPTGHRLTMRTGLPTTYWRKLNSGIPSSKSTTVQVDEAAGMLEALGQVDVEVAKLNGDTAAFRLSENRAFVESMNIEMANTIFYGDHTSAPEEFLGLAPRYSTISGATNGQNILDGGGSGSDNTSIWLVAWSEKGVHGIFPKGSMAGLQHDPGSGAEWVEDASGNKYKAYLDHYQWKCGVALPDWRYVCRIANVDVSDLVGESNQADLIKLMSRAMDRIPTFKGTKPVFYVNRTVFSMLKIQALNKSSSALSFRDALTQMGGGMSRELTFLDIPVRLCDALLETEDEIT